MKKIKVLHVIGNLSIGGAENAAMNYYRYIDKEKFEFHYLVYGNMVGDYEKEVQALGGTIIRVDAAKKNYFTFIDRIINKINEYGPYDIVHSHTLFNSGFILKAAKKAGIKRRIAHSHSIKNKINTHFYTYIYEKFMRYYILKYSTDMVACSYEAGEFLFGKDKFRSSGIVIKNGIDIKKYTYNRELREKIRKEYKISEDKVLIGTIGHLAKVKNHEFIIDLINKMNNEKYMLIIVGEGSERKNLESKINELNLNNRIILTGNKNNVNEILQAMDVFIFPSLYEGLGIALIEAQASGLKCIISDNIPREALITNCVSVIGLNEPSNLWIKEIEKYVEVNRLECNNTVKKAGYDVITVSRWLEKFYIKNRN